MSDTLAMILHTAGLSQTAAYERATLLASGRAALLGELRDATRARDPVAQQAAAAVLRDYDALVTTRYGAAAQTALMFQSLSAGHPS